MNLRHRTGWPLLLLGAFGIGAFGACGEGSPSDPTSDSFLPPAVATGPTADPAAQMGRPLRDRMTLTLNLGQLVGDVVDANCNPASTLTDPSAPLYFVQEILGFTGMCAGNQVPLTAPDGNHLTLDDWDDASGRVRMSCKDGGTLYQFELRGLIPGGLYTVWHFPGTGGGALASHPPGDINNVFRANPAGVANYNTFGTAGAMTFGGVANGCTLPVSAGDIGFRLANEVFVLVYHTDDRDWGPFPGPPPPAPPTYAGHLLGLVE